jgi:dihydropteroate synthase
LTDNTVKMTINCNGKLIDVSHPKIMGILNITPDSFFDGGHYNDTTSILKQVEKMLLEGATFIDVGACSSRPGSMAVTEEEELKRLIQVVELLVSTFPDIILSIDTFRSRVAYQCIQSGAAMINDISAGKMDDNMMKVVGDMGVPYIMMHMKGTPKNMQDHLDYDNLTKDIIYYFSERIHAARAHKINDLIIDPGFGFAKTLKQNYHLLSDLNLLAVLDMPILVGVSRKSMIYKLLDTTPDKALNGTTSLNTVSLMHGANVLRVHDVKEAMQCIAITDQLNP